ncbi:mediator complex subunit 14 isoform X1 [Tachypleus tridentatus]|uniref:mediator complex subunit 14 isoform X1 n=1 Tax=Tachypleus tridentatus TaxID=6853 RepID=UPI003FD25577
MAPLPVDGRQTPVGNMQITPALPPGGGTIPLGRLIEFILQKTYHDLTVLAELLPRKTDMDRKIEIVQFASRTRQLFVRLLALVKWAASASKVEKCAAIMGFLDKQSSLFIETADVLTKMARETLVHARLPSFHIPCAVDVLTLGTYSRLPTCIRDRIVPPDPILPSEKRSTLLRLNQIIQYRLVSSDLPSEMWNLKIENGRVIFHIEHEFEVSLTLMRDGPLVPWRLLDIDILVEDKETGDGKALIHSLQVNYIHQLIQSRLIDNSRPLLDVYTILHSFCLSLQLEVLHSQTVRLCRERLGEFITIEEYVAGNWLVLSYWRDQISKDGQGYRVCVQIDPNDPSKPLQVTHIPRLNVIEAGQTEQAIKSDHLSIEKLLIHTIHIRTKQKLTELKEELISRLGETECSMGGSPAILHFPLLQPCMQSEQLLITVDTHTGYFLAHIPQFEAPTMEELSESLNKDLGQVEALVLDLRYWVVLRRCEKTIQHLPVLSSEQLPLIVLPEHPVAQLGKHKLFIKLCKHHNYYVVVQLKPHEDNPGDVALQYYLMTVSPQPLEESTDQRDDTTGLELELPKSFLQVVNFLPLNTFTISHGPFTSIEVADQNVGVKRKLLAKQPAESSVKRLKNTGYFNTELAHVIAMCDERLPFCTLTAELNRRGICHQGLQVEANGTNFVVKLVKMPHCEGSDVEAAAVLSSSLLSCTLRLPGKGMRAWLVEFVFCNCPLTSLSAKEQGSRRPVSFMYDFGSGTSRQVVEMVDELLQDWSTMVHLYGVVVEFSEALKNDQDGNLCSLMDIKSFTYKKLVVGYGPSKASTVTIYWRASERRFHLAFGVVGQTASASNPHTSVASQLQHEFNHHHSVAKLVQALHDTYSLLLSLSKLPSAPHLGVIYSRAQVPIQTFVIIAQSSTHIRVVYRNTYCLDIHCKPDGLLSIQDGAFSLFDKTKVVEELMPIQGLRAFLNKFVDEASSQLRRLSHSEDDNPPSPGSTLDSLDPFLSSASQIRPSPPSQRGNQEGGATPGGLRFHHPMTPPSNPHTPASPHTGMLSQSYRTSPNPSFPLASPPSLGSQGQHVSPSTSMFHVQAQSPGNIFAGSSPVNPLHAPSPSFLPAPSPSSSSQVQMQSPAGFMGSQSHAEGGSPFPPSNSAGSLSLSSPAPGGWPGSPSVPRPSPRPLGAAQSPGSSGHPALHSPQSAGTEHTKQTGISHTSSRVLPHRSWAAAVPTVLSHKAFDLLCSPVASPQGAPPSHYSPLERFLGCVFMRYNLQRAIQKDDSLTSVQSNEPGVLQFNVETMHCKVILNTITLQSLNLKLVASPEYKDQWNPEELQVLERFFDTKVVGIPYKPNAFIAFGRILNASLRILKDCINIMRLELAPDRNLKWAVQFCLTIPPAAPPIALTGMSAVLMVQNKILLFFQLTRIGLNLAPGVEPQTVVVPILYDINNNVTQLWDRRGHSSLSPTDPLSVIGNMLRRFNEYNPPQGECSIYPALRELLTNLVIPI